MGQIKTHFGQKGIHFFADQGLLAGFIRRGLCANLRQNIILDVEIISGCLQFALGVGITRPADMDLSHNRHRKRQ